jgi:hypothetical protein
MGLIADRVSEKVANYGAVGAVASPWWLPSINDISQWCADLLPIAGFLWLLFQFGLKIYDRWYNPETKDD